MPGYDLDNPYSYDPEAAKAMLDEAGIVDGDGDGYRELDGKNIDISIVATTSRQQDVIAQAYGGSAGSNRNQEHHFHAGKCGRPAGIPGL